MNLARTAFVLDVTPSECECGGRVFFLRRGELALLPNGHRAPDGGPCPGLEWQRTVLRTDRALEAISCGLSLRELRGRLGR